jgi:hypothetical protein
MSSTMSQNVTREVILKMRERYGRRAARGRLLGITSDRPASKLEWKTRMTRMGRSPVG